MRKLLLTLTALVLSLAAMAQTTAPNSGGYRFQMDPTNALNKFSPKVMFTPAKAANIDGTTAWGYFMGSANEFSGLGINAAGATFHVAIFVPGNGLLKGTTVQGINFPVADEGMTDVKVWVRNTLDGTDLDVVDVAGPFSVPSYLPVALNNPIPMPEEGLYVGCTFTCSIAYPIAIAGDMADKSLFLRYIYNGSDSGWADYSNQFNPSALQVLVSDLKLADYSIAFNSAGSSAQLPSSEFSVPVNFVSNGGKEVKSLDVDVTLDGQTTSQHIDLATPVEGGFNKYGSFNVTGTSPAEIGTYDLVVTLKKVNGEDYADQVAITGQVKNLSKIVARRTVIEEFTGTGCGYCPRGWAGMEYMKANYPDDFIGIAFHKYNNTDPLYYAAYPTLGMTGAPGCVVDRKQQTDPYYGDSEDFYGIEDVFKLRNAEPAEVDVNVKAMWNEDETKVDVSAQVEFLAKTNPVSIVYVLTADSLTGTTSAWKQSNYYYQYTAAQLGNAPGLSDFCSGGKYGQSKVSLVFNDAVIGSSYTGNGTNRGESVAADDIEVGKVHEGTYSISQPTSSAVRSALRKDLVTAVVLVVDDVTGKILNAGKVAVKPYKEAAPTYEIDVLQEPRGNYAAEPVMDITEVAAQLNAEPADLTFSLVEPKTGEPTVEYTGNPGELLFWIDQEGNNNGYNGAFVYVAYQPADKTIVVCPHPGTANDTKGKAVVRLTNAEGQYAEITLNIHIYKETQEITRSLSENIIKARVEYETTEGSYVEKSVELTDEQVSEILGDLQLESLADAQIFGWNPTTETFTDEFGPEGFDGWRDANGDFHKWSGNAEVPACVKTTDGKTYLCYNIGGCEPQEIKCYYAIANDTRAVLVEVTFAYVVPTGISELNTEKQAEVIYNLNGVRMQNAQKKGIYIINGRKVVR
ncbi:MAG: hypothetical protein J6M41_07075 [Prevotella sp.]|nr:hypothetical protein [Prevotella sp.]